MTFQTAGEGRALFEQLITSWNNRDLEKYFARFADDVDYRGVGGLELRGVDSLRAFYMSFLDAFPDLTIALTRVVADPEQQQVASMQVETGTHTGDLVMPDGTLPATGRRLTMSGALYITFSANGAIAEAVELIDRASITEQLVGREPARMA